MTTGARILGAPERHDCEGLAFCGDHPRMHVFKWRDGSELCWEAWDGGDPADAPAFAAFAEAITAADRLARGEQP